MRNGRTAASTATEIKNYVHSALSGRHDGTTGKDGSVCFTTVIFDSGSGTVEVKLVAQSPFQNSHYQVTHPTHGRWMGYLTGAGTRNGEYGANVGKPSAM